MYGYFIVDEETLKVPIDPNSKAYENFELKDTDFIEGKKRKKPPEFDLHLALYLFEKEHLPDTMLNELKAWVHENKMAGTRPASLFYLKAHQNITD